MDSFAELPEGKTKGMTQDMFPPANVHDLPLERCWRMMPHDQNTGGFFLALLRKTGELQGPSGPAKESSSSSSSGGSSRSVSSSSSSSLHL